eukprot:scaffold8321_cov138-Isochrysis_galbana.AAC.3
MPTCLHVDIVRALRSRRVHERSVQAVGARVPGPHAVQRAATVPGGSDGGPQAACDGAENKRIEGLEPGMKGRRAGASHPPSRSA